MSSGLSSVHEAYIFGLDFVMALGAVLDLRKKMLGLEMGVGCSG